VGDRSIDVYSQEFGGITFSYSFSEENHLSFSITPFSPPEGSDLLSSLSVKVLELLFQGYFMIIFLSFLRSWELFLSLRMSKSALTLPSILITQSSRENSKLILQMELRE